MRCRQRYILGIDLLSYNPSHKASLVTHYIYTYPTCLGFGQSALNPLMGYNVKHTLDHVIGSALRSGAHTIIVGRGSDWM